LGDDETIIGRKKTFPQSVRFCSGMEKLGNDREPARIGGCGAIENVRYAAFW